LMDLANTRRQFTNSWIHRRASRMYRLNDRPQQGPPGQPRPGDHAPLALRDRLSIVSAIVVALALGVAALLGGELYARQRATSALQKVIECVAQDHASVSFGMRPMLLQLMTGEFPDVSIETAGNQFRTAKGMTLHLQVTDMRLQQDGNSRGTVGALEAERVRRPRRRRTTSISWSDDGIKQTLQAALPFFGTLMTTVTTKPSDGTIELRGALGSLTARPQITDAGLALHLLNVTGFGVTLPPESMQP